MLEQVRKSGFARARVDGIVLALDEEIRLDKKKKHSIDAVVDRLVAKPGHRRSGSPTRSRRRCATARAS